MGLVSFEGSGLVEVWGVGASNSTNYIWEVGLVSFEGSGLGEVWGGVIDD